MLLTINKIHTFRSKVKYMSLLLSSSVGIPSIRPLGSHMKAISSLPTTARSIKIFIGCVIYLAQLLTKISSLVKPINDILKKNNKIHTLNKIPPLLTYAKVKCAGRKKTPDIQQFWNAEHTNNVEAIKKLIVKLTVLHLTNSTGKVSMECDSGAKHVSSVLYQMQNGKQHVIAFYCTILLCYYVWLYI